MMWRVLAVSSVLLVAAATAHGLTMFVNSPGDEPNENPGNGLPTISGGNGIVTLRSAIEEANALEGVHTIVLNPGMTPRIQPKSPLPAISGSQVTILGRGVVLDGSKLPEGFENSDGLVLLSPNGCIDGLSIERFPRNGIRISGPEAFGNLIRACRIGGLTGEGNGESGIAITNGAAGNFVGGQGILDSNLIAGNGFAGIRANGLATQANIFQQNRITRNGVGASGIVLQNRAQDQVQPPELLGLNPVRGTAPPNSQVEFFVDDGAQGQAFVARAFASMQGAFEVDLDLAGFVAKQILDIDNTIPFARHLTATAMDINGNSSAFSNALPVRGEAGPGAHKLRMQRFVFGDRSYEPDGTLDILLLVERFGNAEDESLEVVEVLPADWTLVSTSTTGASVQPSPGSGPVLRWVYSSMPPGSVAINYVVAVPPFEQGLHTLSAFAQVMEGATALGAAPVATEVVRSGLAVIRGRVQELNTNVAITCATVEFMRLDNGGQRYFSVVDGAGHFVFTNLPHGTYARRVVAQGYGSSPVSEVEVEFGFQRLEFMLQSAGTPPLVRGRVMDADTGLPLAGVFVEARVGRAGFASAYTCASGLYEIPRGFFKSEAGEEVDLDFSLPNYAPASQSVNVPPGETGEVEQSLEKASIFPSALLGTVRRSDTGAPLATAQVLLQGPVNTSTMTASSGEYLFDAVLDGAYTVRGSAAGFEPVNVFTTVGSGEIGNVTLYLPPLAQPDNPYDINNDGVVNAVDVQLVINAALGIPIVPYDADVNADGAVNAVDVQLVINAALGII